MIAELHNAMFLWVFIESFGGSVVFIIKVADWAK